MTDKTNVRKNAIDLNASDPLQPITKVVCRVDDDTFIEAGTDDGGVLNVDCPWATQAIVNDMLARVNNFVYQPFSSSKAALDPAAELGDGVAVGRVYSGLYVRATDLNSDMRSDISAPLDVEVENEYAFEAYDTRSYTRKLSKVSSEMRVLATEISAKVEREGGDASSFGWKLDPDGFYLYSNGQNVMTVTASGLAVKGDIQGDTGHIGPWNIASDAIRYGAGERGGLYFGTGGLIMGNNLTISPSGYITAAGATLTGTLNVGGQNISAASLYSGAIGGGSYANNTASYDPDNPPTYFTAMNIRAKTTLEGSQIVSNGHKLVFNSDHTVSWTAF